MRLLTARALLYSLLLHAVVIAALIINFDRSHPLPQPSRPAQEIIEAVTVDSRAVEQELQRLRDQETAAQQAKAAELKELERKARAVEQQRREAERQRKVEEKRKAEAERKRKEEERKAAAARTRQEAEKRRAQQELKRIEEQQRKAEAEKKRVEAARRKAEAERKRQAEAERKRKAEQAAQAQRAKEQAQQDQKLLGEVVSRTRNKVTSNFNKTGLPPGLECVLTVQTVPGGSVVSVTLQKSSGNDIFDRRAVTAVEKASPLPLPADPAVFERLGLRKFKFTFNPGG